MLCRKKEIEDKVFQILPDDVSSVTIKTHKTAECRMFIEKYLEITNIVFLFLSRIKIENISGLMKNREVKILCSRDDLPINKLEMLNCWIVDLSHHPMAIEALMIMLIDIRRR